MAGTPTPHTPTAKVFHWGFIAVFVFALTKQIDEIEELENADLLRQEMVFASIFLFILLVRFIYMKFTRTTALPADTPRRHKLLARSVHIGMYISLSMIAVTGLTIGAMYGAGIKSGELVDAALMAHEIFVHTTTILILMHVFAAVYHRRQRDGIWSTMTPFWKEPQQGQ